MNHALKMAFVPSGCTALETLIPSMESNGETIREREYEIYGTLSDLEDLKKATGSEFQEQWGIPCNEVVNGNIRVRKTVKNDVTELTQTIKVKEQSGNDENNMDISQSTFDIFKKLVPRGLLKTRYFFPLEGTDYTLEVDVFQDLEGNQCNRVKIDLEVPDGVDVDKVILPFKLENVRVIKPGTKSQDDLDFVRSLFKEHYEVVNPYHSTNE